MPRRILLIEPYYGGSHRHFLDGLKQHVVADFVLLTLPARKWKMRMQLSAPWFVQKVKDMEGKDRFFDAVLCSSFIDVSVFKALVSSVAGWNMGCKFLTYFHENQFGYPDNLSRQNIHQFTAINFTSALASDRIAFNSRFNRDSFLKHCGVYVSKAADMNLDAAMVQLAEKSSVLYPGLDFSGLDQAVPQPARGAPPLIIWNHRWEHDKNPEEFFDALYQLQANGHAFRVALLGQSFGSRPACFERARSSLQDQMTAFGFVENRDDYYRILKEGAVVVSTAYHEFFGIAILEAVRAGCIPVLPDRLSYPELFAEHYLYRPGELYTKLASTLRGESCLSDSEAYGITERFSWRSQIDRYNIWLGITSSYED
jgi:glycosyltransferase involved in cell wall biosynthesis